MAEKRDIVGGEISLEIISFLENKFGGKFTASKNVGSMNTGGFVKFQKRGGSYLPFGTEWKVLNKLSEEIESKFEGRVGEILLSNDKIYIQLYQGRYAKNGTTIEGGTKSGFTKEQIEPYFNEKTQLKYNFRKPENWKSYYDIWDELTLVGRKNWLKWKEEDFEKKGIVLDDFVVEGIVKSDYRNVDITLLSKPQVIAWVYFTKYAYTKADIKKYNTKKLAKGTTVPSKETYYISYLNKKNNFKQTDKEFTGANAYEDAIKWGRENLGNFNTDMIRMKHAKGTTISGKEIGLHLPIEMSVYVPSTKDASVPISKSELENRVKQVKEYLANLFGGYSSSEVVGGYASNEGALIQEDVVKVISFATKKAYEENKQKLIDKIAEWSTKWSQEAIGFELEGDLYYINQDKIMAKGGNTDCGCWHYEIGGL